MSTVALIPARGGSVEIPGKNIKKIYGKPLISWSIEQALSSKNLSDVYVSTNSTEIATISRKAGAKVPFLRPEALSLDSSSTESAILHFCNYLDTNKIAAENILLIQCTSPVRAEGRFDDAINFFQTNNYDSVVAVSDSHHFYWNNLECPKANYDIKNRPRRQDISHQDYSFVETGSFYIFKKDKFLKEKNRIFGNIGLYRTPKNEMIDIDNILDFSICERLLSLSDKEKNSARA